jgi:hypothetical protein
MMISFASLVERELQFARQKHPEPLCNADDAARVISGELSEFVSAQNRSSDIRNLKMLAELVSVAAMCQRAAEDMAIIQSYDIPLTA